MIGTVDGALESSKVFIRYREKFVEEYGGRVDKQDGVVIRWTNINLIYCNILTLDEAGITHNELENRLKFGINFMRQSKKPGMFPIFEELLTEEARLTFQATYEKIGFHRESKIFGMAGDISTLKDPHQFDLRFKRLTTQEDLDIFALLNARAHEADPSEFHFAISKFWNELGHAYIGYTIKDHEPVCCAASFPAGDSLFLGGVATDPDYWKHGYGEAVTRKALYEGGKAHNLGRVSFQSSAIGRSLYEKIGMEVTCIIHTLVLR